MSFREPLVIKNMLKPSTCSGYLALSYSLAMFSFSVGKLLELHGEGGTTTKTVGEGGEKIERADNYEPPVLESV